jgi:hypothetical protein
MFRFQYDFSLKQSLNVLSCIKWGKNHSNEAQQVHTTRTEKYKTFFFDFFIFFFRILLARSFGATVRGDGGKMLGA